MVQRWGGDKRGHTRGRSKEPARAVWNRLDAIRAAREAAGTETRVRWVHSHVEAQKGKPEGEPVGKKQKKAAGGKDKAKQGPRRHHGVRVEGQRGSATLTMCTTRATMWRTNWPTWGGICLSLARITIAHCAGRKGCT